MTRFTEANNSTHLSNKPYSINLFIFDTILIEFHTFKIHFQKCIPVDIIYIAQHLYVHLK